MMVPSTGSSTTALFALFNKFGAPQSLSELLKTADLFDCGLA
jgi:hypothetical protein